MQAARAEAAKLSNEAYGVALLDLVKAFEKSRTSTSWRLPKSMAIVYGPYACL